MVTVSFNLDSQRLKSVGEATSEKPCSPESHLYPTTTSANLLRAKSSRGPLAMYELLAETELSGTREILSQRTSLRLLFSCHFKDQIDFKYTLESLLCAASPLQLRQKAPSSHIFIMRKPWAGLGWRYLGKFLDLGRCEQHQLETDGCWVCRLIIHTPREPC